MGDAEVVIDLDLDPDRRGLAPNGSGSIEPDPDRTGSRAILTRWRASLAGRSASWHRRDRWWFAAGLAFGVLLVAGGAATRPAPAVVETLVTRTAPGWFWIIDGRLVTMAGSTIMAYELRHGTVAWTARLDDGLASLDVAGSWLFVNHQGPGGSPADSLAPYQIEARDLRTGAVLQRQLAGWPIPFGPDMLVLRQPGPSLDEDPNTLHVHDQSTLDLLWSMPEPLAWQLRDDARTVYTLDEGGLLTELDARTGTRRRSAQLTVPPSDWGQLLVIGNALWLQSGADAPNDSDERPKILTEQWIELDTMRATELDHHPMFARCSIMLCAFEISDGPLRVDVLDPLTRQALWSLPDASTMMDSPAGLMLTSTNPLSSQSDNRQLIGLVDPYTGYVRAPMPEGWNIVLESRLAGVNYVGEVRYVIRTDAGPQPSTFLSRITPDGLEPLGPLGLHAATCESASDFLICFEANGKAHVLRVTR